MQDRATLDAIQHQTELLGLVLDVLKRSAPKHYLAAVADRNARGDLLQAIVAAVGTGEPFTAGELIACAASGTADSEALAGAIEQCIGAREGHVAMRLGKYLPACAGQLIRGLVLHRVPDQDHAGQYILHRTGL